MTIALRRARAQQREQLLGEAHLGVEVQLHRPVDVLVAAVGELRAPRGARVVDEQVKAIVVLEQVGADACGSVGVGEVGGDVADPALTEQRGQRPQALLAARHEHQRCAGLLDQPPGGRLTDPAGGAGDEKHGRAHGGRFGSSHCHLAVECAGLRLIRGFYG